MKWVIAIALILIAVIITAFEIVKHYVPEKSKLARRISIISILLVFVGSATKIIIDACESSPEDAVVVMRPEDVNAFISKIYQENRGSLNKKFGSNYTVGAITSGGFIGPIGPKGVVPSEFEVKWETGYVIDLSPEYITIMVPTIIAKRFKMWGNTFGFPYKIGAGIVLFEVEGFAGVCEVIGIDQDKNIVAVCFGLLPTGRPPSCQ